MEVEGDGELLSNGEGRNFHVVKQEMFNEQMMVIFVQQCH